LTRKRVLKMHNRISKFHSDLFYSFFMSIAVLVFVLAKTFLFYLAAKSSFQSSPRARRPRDSEDFTCPETNGNYADPKSCRRFYQCVDGYLILST